MNLTVGILIIGSLYWDNDVRKKWRNLRLPAKWENVAISVTAPIRYGRLSTGRGDTYTMVFSPGLEKLGQAKVIPCSHPVSSFPDFPDLIQEAELLWAAERQHLQSDGTLSRNWGCVALLPNPKRNIPKQLLDRWARRVSQENNYKRLANTRTGVSDRGLLQIPWPELVDGSGPLELDLLLATANEPTLMGNPPDYPSRNVIADAWQQAYKTYPSQSYDNYFWNNKKHGITTVQDHTIEQILTKQGIHPPP